ncbi:MAG: citrate/2-methylcitrate synthase [Spirochaetales bacterium]|nr:citrate/2-methylcitrate synthase [Spirochaetales bacterium]
MDLNNKIKEYVDLALKSNQVSPEYYNNYNVKRGLRNADGTGVLVGLTKIGDVHGYIVDENEKVPVKGRLRYRGIEIKDLTAGFQREGRFGFEETCFLILFGELPSKKQLQEFEEFLGESRTLPDGFKEDIILNTSSNNIMNKLARSVLAAYSFDEKAEDYSLQNVLFQCIQLIAWFPTIATYAYQAKSHYFDGKSLFMHRPDTSLSTAENILRMLRPDSSYTKLEAEMLDLMLILHAEHGGGNNSAFTVRVISSAMTDTYSVISAAIGSLKGARHGGANLKVLQMMEDISKNVDDVSDKEKLKEYLKKILNKEAFDKSGLIYGMGHAVYTLSDPRAVVLKRKAHELAEVKGMTEEFKMYKNIEALSNDVFKEVKGVTTDISANVDFYSGFVYTMLGIPSEMFTPLFAIARIPGWCAHRLEEIVGGGKIMRPAYKSIVKGKPYISLEERE